MPVGVCQGMQMFPGGVGRKQGWEVVRQAEGKEPATNIWKPCFLSFKTILTRNVITV